jgi:hypothetical protein
MLEQLTSTLDELLDDDLDRLSDAEVHDLAVGLQRAADRLAAAVTRAVSTWDARRSWSDDGSKSAGARLARECAMSEPSANRVLHRARPRSA